MRTRWSGTSPRPRGSRWVVVDRAGVDRTTPLLGPQIARAEPAATHRAVRCLSRPGCCWATVLHVWARPRVPCMIAPRNCQLAAVSRWSPTSKQLLRCVPTCEQGELVVDPDILTELSTVGPQSLRGWLPETDLRRGRPRPGASLEGPDRARPCSRWSVDAACGHRRVAIASA